MEIYVIHKVCNVIHSVLVLFCRKKILYCSYLLLCGHCILPFMVKFICPVWFYNKAAVNHGRSLYGYSIYWNNLYTSHVCLSCCPSNSPSIFCYFSHWMVIFCYLLSCLMIFCYFSNCLSIFCYFSNWFSIFYFLYLFLLYCFFYFSYYLLCCHLSCFLFYYHLSYLFCLQV